MAVSIYALCEASDVKEDMNIRAEDTDKDAIIEKLIEAYSPIIESYINKYVINRSLTEKYDGDGTLTLFLNYCPIVSITELKIDDEIIIVDDYLLYEEEGKIVLDNGSVFTEGHQNIEIQYDAGYGVDRTKIPYPIKQACISMVSFYMKRHNIDFSDTFSEGFVIKYPISRIPDFIKEFLDPYKRIMI